jgi:hypothetical protein
MALDPFNIQYKQKPPPLSSILWKTHCDFQTWAMIFRFHGNLSPGRASGLSGEADRD